MAKKKTATDYLAEAEAALDRNDAPEAAKLLAFAWSVAPSDRIADLLERLATSRLPPPTPIQEKTVTAREALWLLTAEAADPNDIPTLLSLDWPIHPRGAKERFKAIRTFKADPRIVRSFVELRKSGRYLSQSGITFWRSVFGLLYKWRYPGVHAMFDNFERDSFEYIRFKSLLEKPEIPLPDLDEATIAIIASMEDRLGASKALSASRDQQRAALLEEVYETPNDDAPRLVLADFLIEEGDPRGEFIQLDIQLANDGKLPKQLRERRTALARAGGKKWCEGIDEKLVHVEFRRGFASRAAVVERFDPSHRSNRTLEWLLFVNDQSSLVDVPLHPNLRFLRELSHVPYPLLTELVEHGETQTFDRIDLTRRPLRSPSFPPLSKKGRSALEIRALGAPTLRDAEEVIASGILESAHVTELSIMDLKVFSLTPLLPFLKTLKNLPAHLVALEMGQKTEWHVRLTRAEGAPLWALEAVWFEKKPPARNDLQSSAAKLPDGILASAKFRGHYVSAGISES